MFQDALFESSKDSRNTRRTTTRFVSLFSITLNGAVLLLLLLWPLLHLQSLPKQIMPMLVAAPAPPPAPMVRVGTTNARRQPQFLLSPLDTRNRITRVAVSEAPPSLEPGAMSAEAASDGVGRNLGVVPGATAQPAIVVQAPNPLPKKIIISSGVMAGNRVYGQDPAYPAIARQARIQGTVVLEARISRTGSIENLCVVSGPPMLAGAAIAAVRSWRYRPYLLNEQPVEVETTINIVFNLGS
jgi:protein TonB